jgi:hypothetical protein
MTVRYFSWTKYSFLQLTNVYQRRGNIDEIRIERESSVEAMDACLPFNISTSRCLEYSTTKNNGLTREECMTIVRTRKPLRENDKFPAELAWTFQISAPMIAAPPGS